MKKWINKIMKQFKNERNENNDKVKVITKVPIMDGKVVIIRPISRLTDHTDPYPLSIETVSGKTLDKSTLEYHDFKIGMEYVDGVLVTVIYDIYKVNGTVNEDLVAVFKTGDAKYGVRILAHN